MYLEVNVMEKKLIVVLVLAVFTFSLIAGCANNDISGQATARVAKKARVGNINQTNQTQVDQTVVNNQTTNTTSNRTAVSNQTSPNTTNTTSNQTPSNNTMSNTTNSSY